MPDDIRPGTPCLILLDCREGEPDRGGASAIFEGFFDFETGELRRLGSGIARLRVIPPVQPEPALPIEPIEDAVPAVEEPPKVPGPRQIQMVERLWGFECWWRVDETRSGLKESDHEDLEASKKLFRGLLRDARRQRPLAAR